MTLHEFALANPEAAATILSVLAAVCAGFFGYREARARHRREHTLSVLAPLLTNTHHTIVNHRINDTRPNYNALSDAEREDILQLLGYYEFLAASFLRRDLHRGTVLQQRRSTFRGAWDTLAPFISTRRMLLKNTRVYCTSKPSLPSIAHNPASMSHVRQLLKMCAAPTGDKNVKFS